MPFFPPAFSCKFSWANKLMILLDLQLYGNKRLGYEYCKYLTKCTTKYSDNNITICNSHGKPNPNFKGLFSLQSHKYQFQNKQIQNLKS